MTAISSISAPETADSSARVISPRTQAEPRSGEYKVLARYDASSLCLSTGLIVGRWGPKLPLPVAVPPLLGLLLLLLALLEQVRRLLLAVHRGLQLRHPLR